MSTFQVGRARGVTGFYWVCATARGQVALNSQGAWLIGLCCDKPGAEVSPSRWLVCASCGDSVRVGGFFATWDELGVEVIADMIFPSMNPLQAVLEAEALIARIRLESPVSVQRA